MTDNLTAKEKKYIVKDMLCSLESVVYGGKELKMKEIDKWQKKHIFGMTAAEVSLNISIIKKLVRK